MPESRNSPGATFKYLSANVIRLDNGQTPFRVLRGASSSTASRWASLASALETTPTIVVPSAVEGLEFAGRGCRHQPVCQIPQGHRGPQGHRRPAARWCIGWTDDQLPAISTDPFFANVVMKIDPEVDVLITGHTHNAYNCQIKVKKNYDPMIVTGAGYNGRYLTDIDLTIAGTNGQVIASDGNNIPVETPYLTAVPDAAMKALLDQYRTALAPIANACGRHDHGGYQEGECDGQNRPWVM